MKKLMCLVTVLMMISMFAFSINSFSADEVNNNETTLVTNQDETENEDINDEDFVDMDGHDDDLADEYYMEHGDEDDEDDEDNLATDDEMAYSSGNPAPKESTYDEVGSEMSSPKTSDTDTYTAVVLALLFGSVASVAVYKLKK